MTADATATSGTHRRSPVNTRLHRQRVLLTNGSFPVAIDLARQLHSAGHIVYVVDPLDYHLCKFSTAVRRSKQVVAPHDDPKLYIQGVKDAVQRWRIDLIVPIHEEVFYLADSQDPEILDILFAPRFELLTRLHDKWEYHKLMQRHGMDVPKAYLCKSWEDVERLPVSKYSNGLVLRPCLGHASSTVYHLAPDAQLPDSIDIGNHNWHIAQERMTGKQFCSYSIVRQGKVMATGVYPVLETADSTSSKIFDETKHAGICNYVDTIVSKLGEFSGQLSFDFVEVGDRLLTLRCIPRSTAGLHLWTGKSDLARVITDPTQQHSNLPIVPPKCNLNRQRNAQTTPGMLMWGHEDATFSTYVRHMLHFLGTKDVVWKTGDMLPAIARPFLLTKYYWMCHEAGLQLPELFQRYVLWEPEWDERDPDGCQLGDVRNLMLRADEEEEGSRKTKGKDKEKGSGRSSPAQSDATTLFDTDQPAVLPEAHEDWNSMRARMRRSESAKRRSLYNNGIAMPLPVH